MGNNFSKLKKEKAYELTNREIENDHLNFIRRHALSENEISYRLLLENNLTAQTSLFIKFHLCIFRFISAFFSFGMFTGRKSRG